MWDNLDANVSNISHIAIILPNLYIFNAKTRVTPNKGKTLVETSARKLHTSNKGSYIHRSTFICTEKPGNQPQLRVSEIKQLFV